CWHDDARGAKRGENTIHILQAEGLRVVHLGDLGHLLSEEQAASIGSPDLLMIPVGGFYTIDAKQAARTVEQLSPRIVVPMHFRGKGFGFDNIAPVKDFLKLVRYPQRSFDSSSMEFTAGDECFTALLTCPVKKKR
ncbi:MAG: MBL fold metallo-hydrolase, partial [Oscillospiraceae bacterium]|nr:MBL fold metallo-hydrolase [Oscillospiraceae bacterium]